ncbi:ubiquitin family protein [Apiospora arundinis]|uniref:Ubiquitin family protein n=1 Tax=Apiospora arundinis TaxID=335852 RepID=A0ABR2IIG5_9PEZI
MSLTDQPKRSFIGLSYQDRQLYIPKPDTWDQMITIACQSFPLDREQISKMRIGYLPDIDYNSSTFVRWTVDVQPDGTLTDKKTGLSCSYLFWEAEAQSPDERLDEEDKSDLATFHPSAPHKFMQHAGDYEALPFDEFLPYLDSVLADLCLTTAMRTDFIVYWLPAFQRIRDRGLQIKFTFVPQHVFMKAAGLEIRDNSRMPATETRIFMLFTGVDPLSLRREYYSFDGTKNWVRHVGLNKEVMEDTEAFRVLEWGGMEVPY